MLDIWLIANIKNITPILYYKHSSFIVGYLHEKQNNNNSHFETAEKKYNNKVKQSQL